jgi:urea transporter
VLAVLLHSRAAAVWVATASLVAWLTTLVFGMPVGLTAAGLLGYNALILASGLQGRNIPLPLALGGVVISVWLSVLFFQAQLTTLSAPFVLSAWLVISLQQLSIKEARPPR